MRNRAIELDEYVDERRVVTPVKVPDAIEVLAGTVRAVYCTSVRLTGHKQLAKYGNPDKRPVAGDDVFKSGPHRGMQGWVALASKMVELKAPIEMYIRAQFNSFERGKHTHTQTLLYPTVGMLCGYWGEENWRAYARCREQQVVWQMASDQVQLRVNIQPIVVNLGWPEIDAVEYALRDHLGCVITPLTRYCTAYAHGIESVCRETFRSAVFQYLFEASHYDKILADGIPEPLREEKARILRNMGL